VLTQAEQATRKRDAQRTLQQQRARGARRPVAVATPTEPPAEQVLVIAYEEPDEAAWDSLVGSSAPTPRYVTRTARIRLDKALAALPSASREVDLTDDPQEMRDHVAFCFAVSGWEAVRETHAQLRDLPGVGEPVTEACRVAAQQLVYTLSAELEEVEKRARAIINARLDVSRQQLRTAAETFLTGLDIQSLDLRTIEDLPRDLLRLRPGVHLDALRLLLRDLVPLNRNIAAAAHRYEELDEGLPTQWETGRRLRREAVEALAETRVRRAQRVHETSGKWPLAAWVTDLSPDVRDNDLRDRIIEELVLVRDAIPEVRAEARQVTDWPRETVTAARFRRGIRPATLDAADLGENPFATNMRSPRGPWRYPVIISRALEELGHAPPSAVASAAQEAMGGITATGLVWTMNGGIALLGAVFPPAGVVLGATMAVWNLMVDLEQHQTRRAAYRAVLDPAQSLDVEPSLRGVVAGVIGVVGSVVPGWSGFVLGGAEVVVRITSDDG
jgi:hypothetical protein